MYQSLPHISVQCLLSPGEYDSKSIAALHTPSYPAGATQILPMPCHACGEIRESCEAGALNNFMPVDTCRNPSCKKLDKAMMPCTSMQTLPFCLLHPSPQLQFRHTDHRNPLAVCSLSFAARTRERQIARGHGTEFQTLFMSHPTGHCALTSRGHPPTKINFSNRMPPCTSKAHQARNLQNAGSREAA